MNWESEKDMEKDVEENPELYEALADTEGEQSDEDVFVELLTDEKLIELEKELEESHRRLEQALMDELEAENYESYVEMGEVELDDDS